MSEKALHHSFHPVYVHNFVRNAYIFGVERQCNEKLCKSAAVQIIIHWRDYIDTENRFFIVTSLNPIM